MLACRSHLSEPDLAALSSRERQVAELARIGASNKEIAYELGLAHSTVRVLLARAATKLGAESRAALVRMLVKATPVNQANEHPVARPRPPDVC